MRAKWLFAFGEVLGYTAADVDALSTTDFLMLCHGLERYAAETQKAG